MRKKQFTRDFNHYIDEYMYNCRNLKAFFTWYADTQMAIDPMGKIRQLHNDRKSQGYLEDHEVEKLLKVFDLLNAEFFESVLSRPTITIQSTPKACGHFSLRDDG